MHSHAAFNYTNADQGSHSWLWGHQFYTATSPSTLPSDVRLMRPFTMGVFPATWDELDVCTHPFPKPGHWPIIWPTFEHHFDTMGTWEIVQCWKMGSQDKISGSVSYLACIQGKDGPQIRPETCSCQASSDLGLS